MWSLITFLWMLQTSQAQDTISVYLENGHCAPITWINVYDPDVSICLQSCVDRGYNADWVNHATYNNNRCGCVQAGRDCANPINHREHVDVVLYQVIPDQRCPRSHPYAYRPSHDFDYCCATNVDNFGSVAWSNGGDPESCENNQAVPCPVGTGCVDGEPGVTFVMEVRNPDEQTHEEFGTSISIEGNTMMVGTPNDASARTGSGAVDIFSRDSADSEWVFQGEFHSPNEGVNELFGYGVDFDGDLLVVGAAGNSDSERGAGAAYAYERVNSEWVFQQQIIAPDAKEWDHFGFSVSLVGETLAIGAPYDSDADQSDSGSVYMYTRINSEWVFHSEIFAPDAARDDRFGRDVSIDGNVLAVGAYYRNNDLEHNSGAVYLYELVNSVWVFQGKVLAPDGVAGDQFAVSVSMQGNMMAVGADADDSGWRHDGGSVYLFKRENSEWVFQEEFFAPETEGGPQNFGPNFGYAVCLDGNKVVVGAPYSEVGAVLIYQMGGAADEVTETFSLGGASATLNGATVDVSVNQPGDSPQTKTLNGNGAWAFDTALEAGDEYTVTVQTSSNHECSVVGGTGTISADTTDVEVICLPLFTLGGSSALSGATGVIVSVDQPNSTPQSKTLVDDSQWTFDTKLFVGDVYTVSLGADPTGYTCALAGSTSATITSDTSDLVVTCTPNSYSLGGTSTLDGATGVTVTVNQPYNTPQSKVLDADGAWTFDTELVHGDIFTVSIQEISGFTCSVSGSTSGTIEADTSGVEVTCEKICIAPQASTLDANAITVADSAQNPDGTFLLDVHWPSYLGNVNLEFVTSSEVTSSNWYDSSQTGGWTLGNVDSCTKYFQQSFTFAQIDAVANVVTEGYDMKFDLHFTGTSSYVENGLQYTRGVGKTLTFTISLDQRVSATLDMTVNVAPSFFEATFETAVTNPDVFTDLEQNQEFLNVCTQALVDDGHDDIVCESVAPVQGSDAFIITFGGPQVNSMMALQSSVVATALDLDHVASPVAATSTGEIDSPVVAQAESVAMIQREPDETFSRIEVQFTTTTRSPWSLSENAIEVVFDGNTLVEEPEILPVNPQARRILQEDVVEQAWKVVLKVQTSNVCAVAVHNFEIRFPSVYNGVQFSTTTGVTFTLAPDTAQCAVMQEVGSSPITAVLQIYSDEVGQWARADSNELQFIKFYLDETKRARVTLTNERPITSVSLANIIVTQEAVEKCNSCENLAAFEYQCLTCDSGSTVLRSNDNTLEWQFKLDSDIFNGNVNSGMSTRIQFEFDVTYAQGAGRRLLYHMDVSERRNLQDSTYELPKNSKYGASFDMKDWDCKADFGHGVFEQIIITSCPDGDQILRVCTKQTSKNLDGTYTQVGYWKTEGKTCESATLESEVPQEVQSDQVVVAQSKDSNLLYIVISGLSVALICGAVLFYQRSRPSETPKILSETQKRLPMPATQGEMPTFSVASLEGDVTYLPNEWKDNVAICVNGMGEMQTTHHRQPDQKSLHGKIME